MWPPFQAACKAKYWEASEPSMGGAGTRLSVLCFRKICRWNMVMSDLWRALECLRAPQLEVVDNTSSIVEISNVHSPCGGPSMRFLDTMAMGVMTSGIFLPAWSADDWITLLYSTLFIPILPSDTSLVARKNGWWIHLVPMDDHSSPQNLQNQVFLVIDFKRTAQKEQTRDRWDRNDTGGYWQLS